MVEESLKSIANFFFFAFLDEALATNSSLKVAAQFKSRIKKMVALSSHDRETLIVHLTHQSFTHQRRSLQRGHSLISGEGGWMLQEGVELGAWKQFHKESSDHEMMAVLWSQVLGFTDQAIAEGIGVTVGTVRYRVGHALQKLGAIHRVN